MDVSTLQAMIAILTTQGQAAATSWQEEGTADGDESWLNETPLAQFTTALAALKGGKSKGGKGKGTPDGRECYNCGKIGHIARDCRSAPKNGDAEKGKGKGKGKGEKGDSKGKGSWQANSLGVCEPCEGISLGSLMLNAVNVNTTRELWDGYEAVDALIDSGAGECVCGPDHFPTIATIADPHRATAGMEYVTADGSKLLNIGEKKVNGLSTEGRNVDIKFQVASISQPLISVAKLTAAGCRVDFGKESGSITNPGGSKTLFEKKNGVFVLRIWMPTSGGTRQ